MPNRTLFAEKMDYLARRFGRTLDADIIQGYHRDLAAMSDDAFTAACDTIFREDDRFPSPRRFLDIAGTSVGATGEAAWERALEDATKGRPGRPYNAYEDRAEGAALKAIGGVRTLGTTRDDRLPFVKREFLAAYKAAAERATQPALAAGADATVLPGIE